MSGPLRPSRTPPAGNEQPGGEADVRVEELHRGDRDSFLRFYEAYRQPAYDLAMLLLQQEEDAARLTREAIITVYRRVLLDEEHPSQLRPLVYRTMIDICEERREELERGADEPQGPPTTNVPQGGGELGHRIVQTLVVQSDRHRLALVLNDVHGLTLPEIAMVFDLSTDSARTLLFRAREEFRQSFHELANRRQGSECTVAEEVAASSVGRELPPDEARKLRDHAEYCQHCASAVAGWSEGRSGLGLFLTAWPLPSSLLAAPLFGAAPLPPQGRQADVAAAAPPPIPLHAAGASSGAFAGLWRVVASRAAAYLVAAVCLAASAGVIGYVINHDWRQIVREVVTQPAPASPAPTTRPSTKPTGPTTHTRPANETHASKSTTTPAVYWTTGTSRSVAVYDTGAPVSRTTHDGSSDAPDQPNESPAEPEPDDQPPVDPEPGDDDEAEPTEPPESGQDRDSYDASGRPGKEKHTGKKQAATDKHRAAKASKAKHGDGESASRATVRKGQAAKKVMRHAKKAVSSSSKKTVRHAKRHAVGSGGAGHKHRAPTKAVPHVKKSSHPAGKKAVSHTKHRAASKTGSAHKHQAGGQDKAKTQQTRKSSEKRRY